MSTNGDILVNVNGTTRLSMCDQGCMTCSDVNAGSCAVCSPGYILIPASNNNLAYCKPCLSNCRTCANSNFSQCLTCHTGYFLQANGTCMACNSSCVSCNANTLDACTACPANSVLFSNASCGAVSGTAACGGLCSSCTETAPNAFTCNICSPGATLKSGTCVNCPQNCAQCSVTSLGTCTSCLPGYYLDASTQTCTACAAANCVTCNNLGCQACMTGYTLNENLNCQKNCVLPCATCSDSDPTSCTSCIVGFVFNTAAPQNCAPDIACNNNGTCATCPLGFAMKVATAISTCEQCTNGCARCNPNVLGQCFSCFEGSYLNGTSC